MVVSRQIKDKLSSTPAGVILTIRDFGLEMRYQQALVKALSRLVQQGGLQRIAKGKYYVPKKTIFGMLKPTESELIKDYLVQNGKNHWICDWKYGICIYGTDNPDKFVHYNRDEQIS